jgi:hypothetical protein
VLGETGHRPPPDPAEVAGCQGDSQQSRRGLCVVLEGLEEIAEAEEQDRLRVLGARASPLVEDRAGGGPGGFQRNTPKRRPKPIGTKLSAASGPG